jgi:hypothetical protein
MSRKGNTDHGLEALLALHGQEFVLENGNWVSFRVWRVACSESIPHGIRYALSLHDRDNVRLVGFDNAHAVKTRKRRFDPKNVVHDHWHDGKRTLAYHYENAGKLLADFFDQVEQHMKKADR